MRKDKLYSYALETVSTIVQVRVVLLVRTVRTGEQEGRKMGYGGVKGCFIRD